MAKYYGYASREITEIVPPFRSGIRFELQLDHFISPFLDSSYPVSSSSDSLAASALSAFREFGVNSLEFGRYRLTYLNSTQLLFLDYFFDSKDSIGIPIASWYRITVNDEIFPEGNCYFSSITDDDFDITYRMIEDIQPVSIEHHSLLRSLYRIESTVRGDYSDRMPSGKLCGVKMYYSGAALCVALLDSSGETAGFFDVGFKGGGSSIPPARCETAAAAKRNILDSFRKNSRMTAILSHFHDDHCNLYEDILSIPGTAGHPSSHDHPHHHGLYAMINFNEANVLLAGDCTYAGLSLCSEGLSLLQASHHGGEYALSPAQRQNSDIPQASAGHTVLYSANGITYGHPNQDRVNEHTQCGWTNPIFMHLNADMGISEYVYPESLQNNTLSMAI